MCVFLVALNSCWQIELRIVGFGIWNLKKNVSVWEGLNFSLNDDNELRSQGGTLQLILSIFFDIQNLKGFWGFGEIGRAHV